MNKLKFPKNFKTISIGKLRGLKFKGSTLKTFVSEEEALEYALKISKRKYFRDPYKATKSAHRAS